MNKEKLLEYLRYRIVELKKILIELKNESFGNSSTYSSIHGQLYESEMFKDKIEQGKFQ